MKVLATVTSEGLVTAKRIHSPNGTFIATEVEDEASLPTGWKLFSSKTEAQEYFEDDIKKVEEHNKEIEEIIATPL